MKKRIITILLATTMALSMMACGSTGKEKDKSATETKKSHKTAVATEKKGGKSGFLQVSDVMPITINGEKFDQEPLDVAAVYKAITGHEIEKDWEATKLKPGEGAMFTANNKKGEMIASIQVVNNGNDTITSDHAQVSNMTLIGKVKDSDLTYDVCGLTNTTKDVAAAKKIMKAYKVKNDESSNSVKWFFGVDAKKAKAEKKEKSAQDELSLVIVDSGKKQQNWLSIYFPSQE